MATATSVSLDESGNGVTIEALEVDDSDVADFFSDCNPEERDEMATRAFEIGVKTLQLMDTSREVEYVERRLRELESDLAEDVETLQNEIDEKLGNDGEMKELLEDHVGEDGEMQARIEEAFSEDGVFVDRLDEELGEDGERIRQALDPDNDDSPTHRLEQRLRDEIRSVRDKIAEEETREEMRSKTYLKGGDFEDTVEEVLDDIVRRTTSEVEFTGDTDGEIDRDVGDFNVRLGETGQNIVVEAKTTYYSTSDIKEEMEEASRNRNADYGIFVTDELDNIPATKLGWFHEFPDQNAVVVAMSEADADDLEPGYLRIAFNWARMRAIQSYADPSGDFDPEHLQAELNEIEETIGRFQTIRGHCTEMKKSRKKIEDELDEIEQDIKQRLTEISSELNKTEAS